MTSLSLKISFSKFFSTFFSDFDFKLSKIMVLSSHNFQFLFLRYTLEFSHILVLSFTLAFSFIFKLFLFKTFLLVTFFENFQITQKFRRERRTLALSHVKFEYI